MADIDPLAAARATIVQQGAEIARLRRDIIIERARRLHPIPDEAVEFLIGADEATIMSQARRLSALTAAS